ELFRNMPVSNSTENQALELDPLNVTEMTAQRRDGHLSVFYLGSSGTAPLHKQNCSHWCLPGTAENDGHLRERSSRKKRKRKESKTWMTTEEKKPTVNIAVAGSIIDNAQSLELATLLAGQVARAATIFRIDEVVVFDNRASSDVDTVVRTGHDGDESESGAEFLTMILRYLETPQYLRRRLFPTHKSLKFVGLLPPLDAPHHLRKHEWCSFREGVTLDVNPPSSKGTLVDVGLNKNVVIEEVLEPGK
ncbi:hypothetical protein MUK42_03493, partial [Musa troglodytarum]